MIGNKPTNFLWIKATTSDERGGSKGKESPGRFDLSIASNSGYHYKTTLKADDQIEG
ncbi:unnamed protein product [Penicillium camemberti]|uniref:Str. FM013 n=1 Tax=Penicillium camemberti (strain FM 013) TaxID=1429867 RepID=A0A0G4P9R6_PENC3|nr:unnamed protein product [Penicillium camemberti]